MSAVKQPKVTLEQWTAFRAVVEEGSYAKAAERLYKSQSSVSYMLAKMEERLPAPALVLLGRRATLTDLGRVLYRQACDLLDQAVSIDTTAEFFAKGWETELVLAADALVPMSRLFCALHTFSHLSPGTRVKILETNLSGTDEAVLERRAQITISPTVPVGFLAEPLWSVRMLPVVSKDHALARTEPRVSERELRQHRQIVLRDSGTKNIRQAGWLMAEQRWTVSHFSSSVAAVKAGLGFAFLPEEYIQEGLASGELVIPALEIPAARKLTLNLILVEQSASGPAAQALAAQLRKN